MMNIAEFLETFEVVFIRSGGNEEGDDGTGV